jgi:hypothetical protein
MAHYLLLSGAVDDAVEEAAAAVRRVEDGPGVHKARAQAMLAAALHAAGRDDAAEANYRAAAATLEGEGARRQAAPVWRDLASTLASMGRLADAVVAYERMAAALGVPWVRTQPAAGRRTELDVR